MYLLIGSHTLHQTEDLTSILQNKTLGSETICDCANVTQWVGSGAEVPIQALSLYSLGSWRVVPNYLPYTMRRKSTVVFALSYIPCWNPASGRGTCLLPQPWVLSLLSDILSLTTLPNGTGSCLWFPVYTSYCLTKGWKHSLDSVMANTNP